MTFLPTNQTASTIQKAETTVGQPWRQATFQQVPSRHLTRKQSMTSHIKTIKTDHSKPTWRHQLNTFSKSNRDVMTSCYAILLLYKRHICAELWPRPSSWRCLCDKHCKACDHKLLFQRWVRLLIDVFTTCSWYGMCTPRRASKLIMYTCTYVFYCVHNLYCLVNSFCTR